MKKVISILIFLSLSIITTYAQIGKCKGKYLGNIIGSSVPSNYTTLWNQATSENGSKWGSVEATQGTFVFTTSDIAYNWAKNNNGLFKYHNFVWGSQTPNWVSSASVATIQAEVQKYITATASHYASMGGITMIDVVNEPVNTALSANYKAALTAGYQAEPANVNDKNNQYGWIIWPYQLARKAFPNAILLINEYNTEMNWNSCRAPYLAMANAVKNAPNITDGKKNLIDGIGLQCHGIDNLTAANFKSYLDEIWTTTGLPAHITEFDQAATTEAKQQQVYTDLLTVAWNHPHVAGITIWGYIQGTTWINGNGTSGAGGTDSGIQYANGNDRPALTWLKSFFNGLTSLACCPAPAPFGACANGPSVSITAPVSNASYGAPASSITLTATATTTTGTISKVEFYNGTTLIGTATASPYTVTWSNVAAGTYSITAVATDNTSNKATSSAVTINVVSTFKIYKTSTPITIDGTVDAIWNNASVLPANATKLLSGTVTNAADLSGNCKVLWDNTNLYLLANVTDDILKHDSQTSYDDDGIEIYVDINNDKATTYSANDVQYTFEWNNGTTIGSLPSGRITTGISYAVVTVTGGYVVEASIPWSTLQGTPAVNQLVGFDFMISDDDDGGTRDAKLSWNAASDSAWTDPSKMGTGQLMDVLTCTPPIAPTVTSSFTYCQNATATALTATGTSLLWYTASTGGTGSATAPTLSTATVGSKSYYVSQSVGGCESSRASISITISALPAAPIVITPVNYSQGAIATALTATGTTLLWYTVSIGGTALATAPVPNTTAIGTINYYVSQTTGTCESARATIAVVVTASAQSIALKAGWNIIGCPLIGTTALQSALSSIWSNVVTVKNLDSFYSSVNPTALNSLTTIQWGQGYMVNVTTPCILDWIVR